MSNVAVKLEAISKCYQLGGSTHGTLYESVERILRPGKFKDQELPKKDFWALKDVSFEIKKGEVVGIIGRNGAGKSTMLKILSRITKPTAGRAELNGRVASLLEVGTGFHPELTGRENIYLNGSILGMKRSEIKAKFDEIVAFSGVEKFLDTPVKRYSSGMYVRLAFSVAAHLEPEILIIDEVLAVGDAEFQKKCLGKMKDVAEQGRTVLFVSHNMASVAQLCSRAILLMNGESVYDEKPDNVINYYLGLSSNTENGKYIANDSCSKKEVYFSEVYTCDEKGDVKSNFSFDEVVRVRMRINLKKSSRNIFVVIAVLNRHLNRVFTVSKSLEDLINIGTSSTKIELQIPKNLLAPNSYSFHIALHIPGSFLFDSQDSVCNFKIFDNGTEFSQYEGLDFGSIVVQNEYWKSL